MSDNKVAQKRIWAFHAGPMVGYFVGQSPGAGSNVAEYHRADLSADLVRAGYLAGVMDVQKIASDAEVFDVSDEAEYLAADPEAIASIVAQVMEKENE